MHAVSKMTTLLSISATASPISLPPRFLPGVFSPFLPFPGLQSLPRRASVPLRPWKASRAGFGPVMASVSCGKPMDARPPHSGEIHVICGPMFAGKTTALLRRVQAECNSGRNVAIIKSDKDNRYGLNSIVTHDGLRMPCWALSDLSTFRTTLGAEAYDKLDVIGIDEAQFFEDLHTFCCKAADHDGKIVVIAGLDGDYLRRSFGSVLDLVPVADSVTKLTARCEICGKRASFTLRKTDEMQTELVGGADVYMPVCRHHYVNGQVVIEAARLVLESGKLRCDNYIESAPCLS